MRILFCAWPALLCATLALLLGFRAGAALVFLGVLGFGWSVTERRPERGE